MIGEPLVGVPDIAVIGFAKCGTTSVYDWMVSQDTVARGSAKEPRLFTNDERWQRGDPSYLEQVGYGRGLTVDATPLYTDVRYADQVAERLFAANPKCRLLLMYRDPYERALSHYRFAVSRGDFSGNLEQLEVSFAVDSPFVQRSRYASGLRPFLRFFAPEQMLVVELSQLKSHGWAPIAGHVGLPEWTDGTSHRNSTDSVGSYGFILRHTFRSPGARRLARVLPVPVKKALSPGLRRPPVTVALSAADLRASMPRASARLIDAELEEFLRLTDDLGLVAASR